MSSRSFDEVNELSKKSLRSEPYEQYFDKMEISDEQKEERIRFSKDLESVMIYLLSLASIMIENDSIDKEYFKNEFKIKYLAVVGTYMEIDDYIKSYSNILANNITDATFDNKGQYFLSHDRAMFVSECEANTALNYSDFSSAILSGKKNKTWIDVRDKRERETHLQVGGKTIPISEPFAVGSSLLLYPKDTSLGASDEEIVNCRCTIKYS